MNAEPAYDLECANLVKSFGAVRAVDNVSFNIPRGSFFSILGPSGCGKTTLLRMIAGFEGPDSGDIIIKGRSVIDTPPNRRNVKMVFQHLALFPMMNVRENIAYGLRCNGAKSDEINRKVADVLERVALPHVADREIHQLSGGQKQRIAIARCMVLNPDVLLLDEPLGALDLKLREAMKIELKMLQHQFNTTFIYITHDQSEALVMSDTVAVMQDGQFAQVGTPQSLYHQPDSSFVAGFVGDTNRWNGRVMHLGDNSVMVKTDNGLELACSLRGRGQAQVGDAVSVFVRPEFIRLISESDNTATDSSVNAINGHVDSLLFNGANSRLLVKIANAEMVEVDATLTGGSADPTAGDAVRLAWSASQAMCFKDSQGAS